MSTRPACNCGMFKTIRSFDGHIAKGTVMPTILIIIVLLILFGGFGGGYYGYSHYGMGGGIGILGGVVLLSSSAGTCYVFRGVRCIDIVVLARCGKQTQLGIDQGDLIDTGVCELK